MLFLHDLTRLGEPAYAAADAADRRAAAGGRAGAAGLQQGRPAAPHAAAADGRRRWRCRRAPAQGLDALRQALLRQAGWQAAPEGLFIARTRHVQALQRTRDHLHAGAGSTRRARDAALDLLAEELRLAHRALGEITGEFSTEDLLGEIFGRFCIGK